MPPFPLSVGVPAIELADVFTFHHLGVACESIEADSLSWAVFGYRQEGEAFVDEAQGVRGLFMIGGGPRIELLEATPGSATLAPWLKRRVKLYHTGYFVASLGAATDRLVGQGAAVVRAPMMSIYFKARIAFLMMPNLALIELIETSAIDREGGA